jgi:hypothetical protein
LVGLRLIAIARFPYLFKNEALDLPHIVLPVLGIRLRLGGDGLPVDVLFHAGEVVEVDLAVSDLLAELASGANRPAQGAGRDAVDGLQSIEGGVGGLLVLIDARDDIHAEVRNFADECEEVPLDLRELVRQVLHALLQVDLLKAMLGGVVQLRDGDLDGVLQLRDGAEG